MNPLTSYVATEHLLDLRREAEAEHVIKLAQSGGIDGDGPTSVGRFVGRSARGLSVALDAFASRIDPAGSRTSGSSARSSRTFA